MTDRLKIKLIKPVAGATLGKVYEVLEETSENVIIRADDNRLLTVRKVWARVTNTVEPEWVPNPMTGECPIPDGHDVELKFLTGETQRNNCPEAWYWDSNLDSLAITHYRDWTVFNQQREHTQAENPRSKYHVILKGVEFDIYDLIAAYKITNPALQHLFKKVAKCGQRGHKNVETDLQDIIDSAVRAKELEGY